MSIQAPQNRTIATFTTVTKESGRIPQTDALGRRSSSLIILIPLNALMLDPNHEQELLGFLIVSHHITKT